jgi:hypothetical protein
MTRLLRCALRGTPPAHILEPLVSHVHTYYRTKTEKFFLYPVQLAFVELFAYPKYQVDEKLVVFFLYLLYLN